MVGVKRVMAFSGGRTSAMLLRLELDGGVPPDHVLFCNTGKESENTLRFVQTCSEEWGVDVTWLEYRYRADAAGGVKEPKHHYAVVDFKSASRNGEPFEQMVRAKRMLPNPVMRMCTQELKILTGHRYLRRECGLRPGDYVELLGIRYDEPKRWVKAMDEHCKVDYPLVELRVTKDDVRSFWDGQGFDLDDPYHGGNCDLCYLKGPAHLVEIIRKNSNAAVWWANREAEIGHTFRNRVSYANLIRAAEEQIPLFDLSAWDQTGEVDCYCDIGG